MNFQDEFAEKAKSYLGVEPDEVILKEGYKQIIYPYLDQLRRKIGAVKNENYVFSIMPATGGKIQIKNAELKIEVKQKINKIKILQTEKQLVLDELIVKGGKLFSTTHNEEFKIVHLESCLKKTFGPILF